MRIDENIFTETLHSVQEIMKAAEKPLSREEIMEYFASLDLTEEQKNMVFQYLQMPKEEAEVENGMQEEVVEDEKIPEGHFAFYLEEVEEITKVEKEKLKRWYQQLAKGDTSVIQDISLQWLNRIILIAKEHKTESYLLEDLVQEGNIGLLIALSKIAETREIENIEYSLEKSVRQAIWDYMGEEIGDKQQNESVCGKAALLHEAKKVLGQEGEDVKKLAEYTRIPVEEIQDILSLVQS